MIVLREAELKDLNFLVWIDIRGEGVNSTYMQEWTDDDFAKHRQKIRDFIVDPEKVAFVFVEADSDKHIGAIYGRFRNRLKEDFPTWSIFPEIDPKHFPGDGRFCEPFQLWVDPEHRRKGYATALKKKLEEESIARGIMTMYTHTAERNAHVIDLNLKLGYFEVRRGPIWDKIPRVSLIKHIPQGSPAETLIK